MKRTSIHRGILHLMPIFPALLLIAITALIAAGAGETRSTVADDLVWLRQESPTINANNDPLRYEYPDPRFEGSYTQYYVSEGSIGKDERFVDHGVEFYDVTITSTFDRPREILIPWEDYYLNGSYAHSGTYNGGGMVGAKLFFFSDLGNIDPLTVQGFFPWEPWYTGNATTEWKIVAPTPAQEGQIMKVGAAWQDCPPCNVTWTYEAVPSSEIEQLGVEVLAPVVEYAGEEAQPGETFFPDTCPLPDGRAAGPCAHEIVMEDEAAVGLKCYNATVERMMLLLEAVELDCISYNISDPCIIPNLIHTIVDYKARERCQYFDRASADARLDIALSQGSMLLSNGVAGQSLTVHTAPGTATATAPGVFLCGYHPDSGVALFRAFSAPLNIQSNTGPGLVLQPGQQVTVRPEGFGPVVEMPQVYLPSAMR